MMSATEGISLRFGLLLELGLLIPMVTIETPCFVLNQSFFFSRWGVGGGGSSLHQIKKGKLIQSLKDKKNNVIDFFSRSPPDLRLHR